LHLTVLLFLYNRSLNLNLNQHILKSKLKMTSVDFCEWEVGKLQKYLTERGVALSNANRSHLIELAAFAVCMQLPCQQESAVQCQLEIEEQKRNILTVDNGCLTAGSRHAEGWLFPLFAPFATTMFCSCCLTPTVLGSVRWVILSYC